MHQYSYSCTRTQDIHGTLLRKGDKAMLLPRCGEAHDTAHVISTFNENASTFEFPALSMESGFRARTYHLCWCQVNGNCTSAEHFRAFFGQVRLICPDKQADYNNDGTLVALDATVFGSTFSTTGCFPTINKLITVGVSWTKAHVRSAPLCSRGLGVWMVWNARCIFRVF